MATQTRILRRREVEARTGLSRSTLYAKLTPNPNRPNEHDPSFPKPVKLGGRSVGWIEAEIEAWIESRIRASRKEGDRHAA